MSIRFVWCHDAVAELQAGSDGVTKVDGVSGIFGLNDDPEFLWRLGRRADDNQQC